MKAGACPPVGSSLLSGILKLKTVSNRAFQVKKVVPGANDTGVLSLHFEPAEIRFLKNVKIIFSAG